MAIVRKLAKKYGYEAKDNFTNWRIDAAIDEVSDHFTAFYGASIKTRKFDDEGCKLYLEAATKFVSSFEKKLQSHGLKYVASDKISGADFEVAKIVFNFFYNDAFMAGAMFTTPAKAILEASPLFSAYVQRLKKDLESYLSSRKPSPM